MAERRMFAKKVTDSDRFLALGSSAQALYLHLTMAADDDGFTDQLSLSMFRAHAGSADLEALIKSGLIIQFESGVIVITNWRMANSLRNDRYKQTRFQAEFQQLQLTESGEYVLLNSMVANWLPNGCQPVADWLPQHNRTEHNLTENNLTSSSIKDTTIEQQPFPDPQPFTEEEKIRSSVFQVWDSVAGKVMSPFIGQALAELIDEYGKDRVITAIKMAAEHDAVNIAYVRAVLEGRGKKAAAKDIVDPDLAAWLALDEIDGGNPDEPNRTF